MLRDLGADLAGYYYIAFQIANLLYSVSYAISQSLMAEGSYDERALLSLARRSALFQSAIILPAIAVLLVVSPLLLTFFGHSYQLHASGCFRILLLATPAVALNTWTSTLLRLTKQLVALVWSNVALLVIVCGLAIASASKGLQWVAFAWLVGNAVSGLIGAVALILRRRRGHIELPSLAGSPTEVEECRNTGKSDRTSGSEGLTG